MTESNIVRVSVHLTHFFNDHRQLSRLYINENLKTIGDLKVHLKKIFGIKKKFYLLSLNHFLPSLQDIRVLSDGDSVEVVPTHRESVEELSGKRKKRKWPFPDNTPDDIDLVNNEIVDNNKQLGEKNDIVKEKRKKQKKEHSKNKGIGDVGQQAENIKEKNTCYDDLTYNKEKRKKNSKENSETSQENALETKKKKKKSKNRSNVNLNIEMECDKDSEIIPEEPKKKRKRKSISSEAETSLQNIQNDIKTNEIHNTSKKIKDLKILNDQTVEIVQNLEVSKTYNLTDIIHFDSNSMLANQQIDISLRSNQNEINSKINRTIDKNSGIFETSKMSPLNLSRDIFSEEDMSQSRKSKRNKRTLIPSEINETANLDLSKTQMANWTDVEDSIMKGKQSLKENSTRAKNSINKVMSKKISSSDSDSEAEIDTLGKPKLSTNKSLITSIKKEQTFNKTAKLDLSNSKMANCTMKNDGTRRKESNENKNSVNKPKSRVNQSSESDSESEKEVSKYVKPKNSTCKPKVPERNSGTCNADINQSSSSDSDSEEEKSIKMKNPCANKQNIISSDIKEKAISGIHKSASKSSSSDSDSDNEEDKQHKFKKPCEKNKRNSSTYDKNDSTLRSLNRSSGLDLSCTKLTNWTLSEDSMSKSKQSMYNNTTKVSESPKKDSEPHNLSNKYSSWSESDSILTENEKVENTTINETLSQSLNTSNRSRKSVYQRISSIGHLMSQLSENNVQKEIETNQPIAQNSVPTLKNAEKLTSDFVTKRKRVRVRKRSKKSLNSSDIGEKIETQSVESYFQPPNSAAAPKMHKRFSEIENEDTMTEDNYGSPDVSEINGNVFSSTPYSETNKINIMSIIPEEKEEPSDFLKKPGFENLKNLTVPPKVDDEIVFKKLKLNEEYTPVISELIIGKVKSISKDQKKIEIRIIAGHEEFQEPKGIFSVGDIEDEIEEPEISVVELEWSTLIEPKLVNGRN